MDQARIFSLLTEAASPHSSPIRAQRICDELKHSAFMLTKHESRQLNTQEAALLLLLERLFEETLTNNNPLLPSLFPVFALICGDKEKGTLLALEINWQVAKI